MSAEVSVAVPSSAAADIVEILRSHRPERKGQPSDEILATATRLEYQGALAELTRFPFLPGIGRFVEDDLLERFDATILRRGQTAPIRQAFGGLVVALANPFNTIALDYFRQECGEVVPVLTTAQEVDALLERVFEEAQPLPGEAVDLLESYQGPAEMENFELGQEQADPVPDLIRRIFHTAVSQGASDIHFKTEQERFYYSYRINGDLTRPEQLDPRLRHFVDAFLLSLVRVPREETVKRIGISGRFSLTHVSGRKIDCRYERHRTYRGFHVTVRLLDKALLEPKLGVGTLAFDPPTLLHLRRAMEMADGIIIFSGPTGSGKSTTLNAMLREISKPKYNTLTLENPVEDEVPGVTHCDMRDNAEFGDYIRSFMRSDPDILLMGEVRDLASAKLAVEAAITGHQVLTTIHTPSAAEILDRFEQLGVERVDIARTLRLLCAQRLVKLVCPECSFEEGLTAGQIRLYNLKPELEGHLVRVHSEEGCPSCRFSGYVSRTAVLELLPIDKDASQRIVREKVTAYELEVFLRTKYELKSLQDLGVEMILAGKTDLAAIKDVINLAY